MSNIFSTCKYIPILAISPAEMAALEQLPDKDKDQLLPLFPLKGWAGAHRLESTIKRIKTSISERKWIADIEITFLTKNKIFMFTGKHPETPIYTEIKDLLNPEGGYENWFQFIAQEESAIPCIRHEDLSSIHEQIDKLSSLNRGLALRIRPDEHNIEKHKKILEALSTTKQEEILVIYDLEDIDDNYREKLALLELFMAEAKRTVPKIVLSVSSSSFPSSFSGRERGENSIYERALFNKISDNDNYKPLIYSDRGSARAQKRDGGAGTPPPRIDYPLKKDWMFVRREVEDNAPNSKARRKEAYIEIANEITKSDFWLPELRLWGTQQIEITAEGSDYGINSAQKSTAVRINIHLFVQLHYDSEAEEINTDEEWTD